MGRLAGYSAHCDYYTEEAAGITPGLCLTAFSPSIVADVNTANSSIDDKPATSSSASFLRRQMTPLSWCLPSRSVKSICLVMPRVPSQLPHTFLEFGDKLSEPEYASDKDATFFNPV